MNTTASNNSTNKIRSFFWWSAGAVIPILEKCPTEQGKYTALGVMMFFIALLSCVSFAFFLSYTFESNGFIAFIGGLAWACLIFCLERVVLTSYRKGETSVISIVLRFVLVFSTAFVIGEPLALRFFEKEIKLEMLNRNRSTITAAREEVTARYQTETANLEKANNDIQTRLDLLKTDRDDKEKSVIGETEGISGSGKSGFGIAAKQKETAFKEADAKYLEAKTESAETVKQNNARLAEIRKEIEDQTKLTGEAGKGADGILARHEALFSLVSHNAGAAAAYFPIFIILILLETLPLTVKVFGKKGVYDSALEAAESRETTEIIERQTFENENLVRSRELQKVIVKRLFEALVNGQIENITDVDERRVADILKNESLLMTEKEAFNRQAKLINEEKFGTAIIVEVIGNEEFEFICEMPKNAQKTLSLNKLSGDIAKIVEKLGGNLRLAKAFSSAEREISASLPILSELENDLKLYLEFETIGAT